MRLNSNSGSPILCKVSLRSFHSERGLLLHRRIVNKYNRPKEHIDMLPSQTVKEFQENFVYHIHRKLSKSHTRAERQTVSLPCTIKQKGVFTNVFFRELEEKQLNYIFNDGHDQ